RDGDPRRAHPRRPTPSWLRLRELMADLPVSPAPDPEAAPASPVGETVALAAYERIVARGVERQTWLVCADGQWRSPKALEGATLRAVDARPGTVWESVATVTLARGAWVKRIIRRPGVPVRRDPMAYLQRQQLHASQATQISYYRVGHRGVLRSEEHTSELQSR